MAEPIDVVHDHAGHRFVVTLDGHEAFLRYRASGKTLDLYHTYVPDAFRGRGIAERLCHAAFEHASATHLTVIPSCSYVSGAYLARHPEYLPLTTSRASNPSVSP